MAEQQEERRRRQVYALSQLDCLQDVPNTVLLRLAHLCVLRAFLPGTLILNELAPIPYMYLILRGTVSLTLRSRSGDDVLIGVLNRGDCFGEGPLFGDVFRGATAHAETSCYLLQIALDDLRSLLDDAPELDRALRATYRRRLVESTLGRVPLFSQLPAFERTRIAMLLQPSTYDRDDWIIRQGSPGDALYLIESGQVVVERDGRAIAHMDEGDFFGEMSLLTKQAHNADIRALTPVRVLALPAVDFERLLQRQPALTTQLREFAERRRAAGASMLHDPERSHQLSVAVERGMLRGSRLIVRDPQLCVEGCKICENACATRHGQARLRVEGVPIDGLFVTDACRQCRFGAECVEACPEDAIQWNGRGALIITDNCTGCGDCVSACPYDAVQLVPRQSAHLANGPLWSLWHRLKQLRTPTIPLEATRLTHRADKCDLCHGHNDLACVSACPTGALRLVPVEELFPF